jgi:hypothetical protein
VVVELANSDNCWLSFNGKNPLINITPLYINFYMNFTLENLGKRDERFKSLKRILQIQRHWKRD